MKIGLFLHNDVYEWDIPFRFRDDSIGIFYDQSKLVKVQRISYIIGCFFELYEKFPLKMVSVVMFFEHRL